MEKNKKVMFSGIQPSGDLTIGNYLGAIKNWTTLQNDYDCYFSIVDLHAITVKQIPANLRKNTLEILAIYISSGISPDKNTIFIQSHVPAHSEANWLLNCSTYMGELSRMTQFKDKSRKLGDQSIPVGLFDYPVLMTADILLYQTDLVPVGVDQKQHVELCRDVASRFNNEYSDTFVIPEPYVSEVSAKIYGLQDPTRKMSKSSENVNDFILIMDPPDVIRNKINRAVTDNLATVKYSIEQPGIKNLMTIYSALTLKSYSEIEAEFEGQNYKTFKEAVANAIIEEFEPIQTKVKELLKDKVYLETVYKEGAQRASYVANKTLRKMKKKIGFIV